ncbi:MAG: bifunctional aldolase/short-chain dehydrogenase [Rhizobiales bacterium]|nr:bifunctional aldolase/short-chain dehydrogenase [Hyphomicrobiales bacterium]MBO6698940.1 bifunctional aldolase/short-chain dehydrogenase [Hyphomicrobiales bacterium]MBO6734807.1 bifunctional aldolase/short-chain dehydrogenase [Hyphomicrobiales bacterium]MBO6911387.1 bifunctional aldolase/short-chain dehydrogenase [Hyphomicrobiales bacterium]MBO6955480.1 bifunctional aldolase/short-chain dehydrogenase [Hyphomicrobiales bacterium]
MDNRWSDADAQAWVDALGPDASEADKVLAHRVYTSQIIGQNPDLVMHGGGNTSVKVTRPDLFGEPQRVLHVKGSGWDLDTIQAPGLPGVRLDPLLALRALDALSDEEMVNVQRQNLLDSTAPNPSVETLLHAFLPHTFVDHTHATPFLVLANLPNAEDVARQIFGGRLGIVPYIMPGFALAKAAAEVYDSNPDVEGLLLLKHGHFAFGPDAKSSYDLIVSHTNEVADFLKMQEATSLQVRLPAQAPDGLARLRGALAADHADAAMPILALRNGSEVMTFFERNDATDLATRGVASPDHVIRTKAKPLVLSKDDLASQEAITAKINAFKAEYEAYFTRQNARVGNDRKMLSPSPNLVWAEGFGLIGIGSSDKAAHIAADLGEQNLRVRAFGEDVGGFKPIQENDLFDMEYWSLEQAKLGKGKPAAFASRVVMVTGGGGAIGHAIAKAFAALGASVFLVDRDKDQLAAALKSLGASHDGLALDVTDPDAAEQAMDQVTQRFGGLDILLSNAGAALSGALADLTDEQLRAAFELNFFSHQRFAKEAAALFARQGRGGQMLFNISKQAVNPGKNFGAYGMPKATTFFLMRQLALELGDQGIRVNGVNADRIRSGLLTDDFIAERAKARGTDEASYMAGNLLKREVEAHHVADAFTALAHMERTTGHVVTVDGGNIEAALR